MVAGDRVFTFSAEGILQAVDRATGERLWRVDTADSFAVPKGFFGAASSPMVVGDRVLLNVGGREGAGGSSSSLISWTSFFITLEPMGTMNMDTFPSA